MTNVEQAIGGPVVGRQGNYAGAVSRLVAFAADIGISWGLYSLGVAGVTLFTSLVSGHSFSNAKHRLLALVVVVVWEFIYFTYQWAVSGKTLGMAIFGIKVVSAEGAPIGFKAATIRTITLPISIFFFGIGLIGIIVQRERRAFHDLCAHTCVVYAWDARAARLRWLAKNDPATPAHGS